jgi:hypothetical protein
MVEDFVSSSVVTLWLACELFDLLHCTQDVIEKKFVEKIHVYLQVDFVFLGRKCDEVLLQTQNQEKQQIEPYKARIKVSIKDTV